jgi:hypothetical protein
VTDVAEHPAPPAGPGEPVRREAAQGPAAADGAAEAGNGGEKRAAQNAQKSNKRRRSWWRVLASFLVFLIVLLVGTRLALPTFLRWYVNRTLDQNPFYDGRIGDIDVHLWRGAYTINDIRLLKTTGNVPVPLFAAKHVDLAIQWDALLHRKVVGRIRIDKPELNFVDAKDPSEGQTGDSGAAGAPWLQIIKDLFPFKINSCIVRDGTVHFRAFDRNPPVDVYMSHLDATVTNLTNVQDEITPMMASVRATALAMDQAKFEYEMKLDPFSYRPTFQLAVRLLNLDVTKLNEFARAYGGIDFENGYFDLVVEADAKEGAVAGYVKPLFRKLKVLTIPQDLKEDNVLEFFWEAIVGVAEGVLKNQSRDQFGTQINFRGDLSNPSMSILEIIGNVLRNAFIRAYLPRFTGGTPDLNLLEFGKGSITEPTATGDH